MRLKAKTITAMALAFWGTLAFACALAFVNNVVVISRWWAAFAACGGDSSQMPKEIVGWGAWIDWSAVDYSAVSTFIPLFGCLCVVKGLLGILFERKADPTHFPFFAAADQLNVALGLVGTLWGIIVIGYFQLDKVSMYDLMHCLHTALFSTLVAVVWVFVVDHPIVRPMLQGLLAKNNLDEPVESDVLAAVEKLTHNLVQAAAETKRMGDDIREINAKMEKIRDILKA
ncbi:MAG: hypothetical protein MJ138_00200 [Kiritimatiellae bacterium]|nr:hypothetical protein [Kiritimatiellia bacterium]